MYILFDLWYGVNSNNSNSKFVMTFDISDVRYTTSAYKCCVVMI